MTRLDIHGVTIECVLGDIAKQPGMDAIVNTANAELRIGGGMAGAIHQYGSAVELIRMVSGSSFEGYQMSLMALQGNQDSGKERG